MRQSALFSSTFSTDGTASSEEDNDPLTDDAASAVSIPVARLPSANNARSYNKPSRPKHHLASSLLSDDGVDSPTYDGDIESSTTAGPDVHFSPKSGSHYHGSSISHSSTNSSGETHGAIVANRLTRISGEPSPPAIVKDAFDPAALTPQDIQAFVQKAIQGESWRSYRINPPPSDRTVRVYADGLSYRQPDEPFLP